MKRSLPFQFEFCHCQNKFKSVKKRPTIVSLFSQEPIASSEETGQELEQVEALQKKFDNFKKDLNANEGRLDEINQIAKGVFEACPHLIRARAPSDSCAHCESRHPCVAGFRRV